MTPVPLPDTPALRARFIWSNMDGTQLGTRMFFSYPGAAPDGDDLNTLASDIEGAYSAHLSSLVPNNLALTEIDILDIATADGNSGSWIGDLTGGDAHPYTLSQCAFNVQYKIARRYRGGKPRGYWPFGGTNELLNSFQWEAAFVAEVQTQFPAFVAAVNAISAGPITGLVHINLSYKSGFENVANSSHREHAVPLYKSVATHDNITGYLAKQEIASQRRRRTSTTP